MTISSLTPVEEKYTSVKQLIELGKEKGYLLYDEIYEMLPEEVVSLPDELDEIYHPVLRPRDRRHRPPRAVPEPRRLRVELRRVRQERGRDHRLQPHGPREDERPRAHVPARDGDRAAARPRGRGRDRPAHRAGRVDDLRGAVREPGGAARAPAPERDGAEGQAHAARADRRRPGRAARPKAVDRIKGNLKIFEQIAVNDHEIGELQQAPEALQARRREVPGDRARDRPAGGEDRQGHPHHRLLRADPEPPGRLPQGHRPAVLAASSRTSSGRRRR